MRKNVDVRFTDSSMRFTHSPNKIIHEEYIIYYDGVTFHGNNMKWAADREACRFIMEDQTTTITIQLLHKGIIFNSSFRQYFKFQPDPLTYFRIMVMLHRMGFQTIN